MSSTAHTVSQSDAPVQPERRRARFSRHGRLWIALVAAIGGLMLLTAVPAIAAGGCSAAAAPAIAAGATQTTNGRACPDGLQYWAIGLQTGDTLNLSGVPGAAAGYLSLDVYGPNVQTIGQSLCSDDDNLEPFSASCVIPASGEYLIVATGSGSFTPTITAVPGSPPPVAGACGPVGAPSVAPDVTQYANAQLCQPAGSIQYWAISLQIGQTLNLSGVPGPPAGYLSLDVYGPNVQTIGQSLCSDDDNLEPFSASCVIPATGQYFIVATGSGSFTPTITSAPGSPPPVLGSCGSVSAPSVASDVTQYANTQVCQPAGSIQFWSISLQIGQVLNLSGVPGPPAGYLSLDVYGPNVRTIGQSLCSDDDNLEPFSEACAIPAGGRYLIVAGGAGNFTPVVSDPLLDALHHAVIKWSRSHHGSTISVQASAPRASTVCVIIAAGWPSAPSLERLSCGTPVGRRVLASGRHTFPTAGSAAIEVRLNERAKHRLAARGRKVTLITIYSVQGRVASRTSIPLVI